MICKFSFLVVALCAWHFSQGSWAAAASVTFTPLGDLDGGEQFESLIYSQATGISADGSVVVGDSIGIPIFEPFIWTHDDGMTGLGFLNGPGTFTSASAISGDGLVVVGAGDRYPDDRNEPFRWTAAEGMTRLGHLPGSVDTGATAVSYDGSVIVGGSRRPAQVSQQAYRWTPASGMIGIGDLPGGLVSSYARGVSADGSVVVGSSQSSNGGEAFRWTEQNGMVGLGDLPGGGFHSFAMDISADGSAIVGAARSGRSGILEEAFLWTAESGMVGLGDLPGGPFYSVALAASDDGSVVVGQSYTGDLQDVNGIEAFIWDEAHGMRSVQSVLASAGVNLSGWGLRSVTAITPDGRIIAGWGTNSRGVPEAWIADISGIIPEPNGSALMMFALLIQLAGGRLRTNARRRF